ncbi:MAG: hypothetical protein JSV49_07580, partial [Thermoplasmata archaeon]
MGERRKKWISIIIICTMVISTIIYSNCLFNGLNVSSFVKNKAIANIEEFCRYYDISPDDKKVVYTAYYKENDFRIYWMDING